LISVAVLLEQVIELLAVLKALIPSGNTNGNAATNTGKITPVAAVTGNVP
jgi:hypothetical protein